MIKIQMIHVFQHVKRVFYCIFIHGPPVFSILGKDLNFTFTGYKKRQNISGCFVLEGGQCVMPFLCTLCVSRVLEY